MAKTVQIEGLDVTGDSNGTDHLIVVRDPADASNDPTGRGRLVYADGGNDAEKLLEDAARAIEDYNKR